jgi:hypothetical protein
MHLPNALPRLAILPALPRWAVRAAPVALLLVLCGLLFFVGLNERELCGNEGLRAILAAEVLRGGSWSVPTLYGEPLLTKPPGMSLAIALASWPAGAVSAASARLPSALVGTLTVLLFYFTFARYLGRRAGLLAAVLLPCTPLWLGRVPSAEIDLVQLAWVTAALLFLLRALEAAEESRGAWRTYLWWQVALLGMAGGLLTKWTAPAFFYLTALPLLAWRRQMRLLGQWPHLLALAVAGGLCLAWGAAVLRVTGWDALAGTLRREALLRLSPAHHPRPYPWGELLTFPLGFLLGCLPASACALLTLRRGFADLWDPRTRRLLHLLHCWAWANLLFWTLVPGHKPRHALPLQPALAGLAALGWVGWSSLARRASPGYQPAREPRKPDAQARVPARAALLLALVLAWLGVKFVYVFGPIGLHRAPRSPRAGGEMLARRIPQGDPLYLFGLKDEGILFYYGRPALRLAGPERLPVLPHPAHCLLRGDEWRGWPAGHPAEVMGRLLDERGAELVLVRVRPPSEKRR